MNISNVLSKCIRITVTPMGTNDNYLVVIEYTDQDQEIEQVKASSLYDAYLKYMDKHGYFDTFASKVKRQEV